METGPQSVPETRSRADGSRVGAPGASGARPGLLKVLSSCWTHPMGTLTGAFTRGGKAGRAVPLPPAECSGPQGASPGPLRTRVPSLTISSPHVAAGSPASLEKSSPAPGQCSRVPAAPASQAMDTSVGPPRSRGARCDTHLCACGLEDVPGGISELQPERGWRPLSPGSLPVPPRECRTRSVKALRPLRLGEGLSGVKRTGSPSPLF